MSTERQEWRSEGQRAQWSECRAQRRDPTSLTSARCHSICLCEFGPPSSLCHLQWLCAGRRDAKPPDQRRSHRPAHLSLVWERSAQITSGIGSHAQVIHNPPLKSRETGQRSERAHATVTRRSQQPGRVSWHRGDPPRCLQVSLRCMHWDGLRDWLSRVGAVSSSGEAGRSVLVPDCSIAAS